MPSKLEETVTITRPVPQNISDLVFFVRFLAEKGVIDSKDMTDEKLLVHARTFWQREHGEE